MAGCEIFFDSDLSPSESKARLSRAHPALCEAYPIFLKYTISPRKTQVMRGKNTGFFRIFQNARLYDGKRPFPLFFAMPRSVFRPAFSRTGTEIRSVRSDATAKRRPDSLGFIFHGDKRFLRRLSRTEKRTNTAIRLAESPAENFSFPVVRNIKNKSNFSRSADSASKNARFLRTKTP